MAENDGAENLESWLNKATDPNNEEDRWDCIQEFYQLVNQDSDGPQVATRLLAHKIQSPQEREALQALTILEACMNNCGRRFHAEAVKFRFLNELIKVLAPKYLGRWSSDRVKEQVTAVLYGWTLWLKEEAKIQEAYRLLKKQGIVKKDPKLPDRIAMAPPPQRTTESVFDQEGKAELLARLLKSTCPEDLRSANRLIKNTLREEQDRVERESRRDSTLKEVETRASQLRELLDRSRTAAPMQHSEELKVLSEHCDRLRPSLFRLASETTEDDVALAQILAANDELTRVVTAYKETVPRDRAGQGKTSEEEKAVNAPATSPRGIRSYHLIDLSTLDSPPDQRMSESPLSVTLPPSALSSSSPFIPSSPSPPAPPGGPGTPPSGVDLQLIDLGFEDHLVSNPGRTQETHNSYADELMLVSRGLQMNADDASGGRNPFLQAPRGSGGNTMSEKETDTTWSFIQNQASAGSGLPVTSQSQPVDGSLTPGMSECSRPPRRHLTDSLGPGEAIRPGQPEPVTVCDRAGLRVSLHFSRQDPPVGPPGVAAVVLSAVNTSVLPVRNFLFQAAVPKGMSVRLQPSSGSGLPPFNPLLPPPAISQVLLLSNPQKLKVRLRYKLALSHGDQPLSETGELDSFPPWTSLVDV